MAKQDDLATLQTLAAPALEKLRQRKKLTAREERAIRRLRDYQDEQKRQEHYAVCPKKHFVAMAGRQHKQIDDFHRQYGAPVDGPEVNLNRFVRWVFDFFAENGRKLLRPETDDELLFADRTTPALERLREVTCQLKALELAQKRKELIPRSEAHAAMAIVASQIRSLGLALQERFGRDALDLVLQHLSAAEAEIAARLADEPPAPDNS